MDNEELRELGLIIAINDYCEAKIENAKEMFRKMPKEEIEKINKGIFFTIEQKDYTKTTYSEEYKQKQKELQKEYPPTKETFKDYSTELKATSYSESKADIIIDKIFKVNKTTLQNMVASATQKTTSKTKK